ncbi:MAG: metallophosphoesterase [Thermoplasmata archaeon]|nr:metallophosphoesterase [Thermoplasmata archaeon]
MREALVRYFEENQRLIEAEALSLLLTQPEPLRLSRRLLEESEAGGPFVTRGMVERMLAVGELTFHAPLLVSPAPTAEAPVGSTPSFRLLSEGFAPGVAGRKPLEAYEGLFHHRYRTVQRWLKGRPDLPNLVSIKELRGREGTASVVGIVREVRITSEKKHTLLALDDETGSVELLLPRDSPATRTTFLLDEVLGLTVSVPRESGRLPIVRSVHRPDIPASRPARPSSGTTRAMFLSDLHIGSRSFLGESWSALAGFLRGEGPDPEVAAEIRHVVVAGDLVDGIGIYPHQERDLAIHDILEQYVELGRRLAELPARLNVIVIPGNHDAVCPAEPQPALPAELAELLPPNVRALGNPSTFSLEGTAVSAYHGRSFDDLIPAIPGASYARPTEVMKGMLSMRHLAPIYGGRTPIAPLPRDGLLIDPVPDIFVTGHAHTFGADRYRGVLLLNASTWQAETEYQRMRNITPIPARAAVVRLSDLSLTALDFSDPGRTAVAA